MNLPKDVLRLTIDYLDDLSLAYACMINKDFNERICNDDYWLNKIFIRYNTGDPRYFLSRDIIDKYKKGNTYWAYYYNLNLRFSYYNLTNKFDMNVMLRTGARLGRLDIILITLQNGATNINDALITASIKSNYELVEFFLNQGADIDNLNGQALFFAVGNKNVNIVNLLLERGADPNLDDGAIMQLANRMGDYDIIELLSRYGGNL